MFFSTAFTGEYAMKTKDLIAAATSLPVEERALLAESILKSLHPKDPALNKTWTELIRYHLLERKTLGEKTATGLSPVKAKKLRKLSDHPAFGEWRKKQQDGLVYQKNA